MNFQMRLIVPYYRVSTRKQGESGLGLEAQRTTVERFRVNEHCSVIAEFIEIESGKKSNRPELAKAIALAKDRGAILVVAKLDRLARNVAFTSALMESGVDFVACDMPSANRLTIHIMAAMAEDEARRISQRTRDALAELKAKGVPLGSARPGHWETINETHGRDMRGWNALDVAKKQQIKRDRLTSVYADVLPVIESLRELNLPNAEIAATLQRRGFKTPKGCAFTTDTVYQIVTRLEAVCEK